MGWKLLALKTIEYQMGFNATKIKRNIKQNLLSSPVDSGKLRYVHIADISYLRRMVIPQSLLWVTLEYHVQKSKLYFLPLQYFSCVVKFFCNCVTYMCNCDGNMLHLRNFWTDCGSLYYKIINIFTQHFVFLFNKLVMVSER